MTSPLFIELNSDRLRLIAATAETVEAEIKDHGQLADLLQADVPKNWPPDLTEDVLETTIRKLKADPARVGWYSWYIVRQRKRPNNPIAVGICSFKGRPKPDGTVDIGYSVLHQHRKRGYATETVRHLLKWAFSQEGVRRVISGNLSRPLGFYSRDGKKRLSVCRTRLGGGRGAIQLILPPGGSSLAEFTAGKVRTLYSASPPFKPQILNTLKARFPRKNLPKLNPES